MKKYFLLVSLILLLVSCIAIQEAQNVVEISQQHQRIAVVPIRANVERKLWMTQEKHAELNQLKSEENLAIQQAMRVMNMEGGKKATIYIVYLKNTQDEVWMLSALQGFDQSKIKKIDLKDLPNGNKTKSKRTNKKVATA